MSRSSSRREGDFYQDVYGWFRVLELLKPARKVWRVSIEDPTGELFDDVTVRPVAGTSHASEFAQVKFHVDQSGAYSTDEMMTRRSKNGRSLLQKAWDSWLVLREDDARVQLLLVTTWAWHPDDPIARHIRHGVRLTEDFIEGRCAQDAQASRTRWHEHVGSPNEDLFRSFLSSLQIRVGYPATSELMEWTAERMELAGLKSDEASIRKGAGQILDWIIEPRDTIYRDDLEAAIRRLDLRDPEATPDLAVSLYIHTIVREPLEIDGDYELDWRDHFEGQEWLRGHRVHDPRVWNAVMLPELIGVRDRIANDTSVRLLRARGKARLSAWFAIGWVFSHVAGWTIEVEQNGNRWRDDAPEADDITLNETLDDLGGEHGTLAVGVSITGDLSGDVQAFLAESGVSAEKFLHVSSNLGMGPAAIRSASDLTTLAHLLRDRMRTALGRRPKKILLFYFGPLSGAAVIGASLNAVAGEVQIFEDQNPGYSPSFTFQQ